MGLIVRGTKTSAGGGTAFVTATVAEASEVNTDFDTVYAEVNGQLDTTNLKAAAAVAETQIDDISATAATHDDTTTPGDSSSHTLPTTLSGEVQQLRYVEERLALGIGATREDASGTGTTFWGDLPARPDNLVINPNFVAGAASGTTPPKFWTSVGGSPTFTQTALSGATLSEGAGFELRCQAGSAAKVGVSQTFANLKASTRYLVVARARATTNAAHLTITGANATSSFRNFDATTSSTTFVTLKGVIQTDSTPTDVVISLTTNGANGDDVKFAFCGLYECSADFLGFSGARNVSNATGNVAISSAGFTDLGVSARVRIPSPGWVIDVWAEVPMIRNANDGTVGIQILESQNGGANSEVGYTEVELIGAADKKHVHFGAFTGASAYPAPGVTYTYTLAARSSTVNTATIPGAATVTGGGATTPKAVRLFVTMRRV